MKRLLAWFNRKFGGARKTNKVETAKVLALKKKYERWAKEKD